MAKAAGAGKAQFFSKRGAKAPIPDLEILRDWGKRVWAFSHDGRIANIHARMIFNPGIEEIEAKIRLGTEYPYPMQQIDACVEAADEAFGDWLEGRRIEDVFDFNDALFSLYQRIGLAASAIERHRKKAASVVKPKRVREPRSDAVSLGDERFRVGRVTIKLDVTQASVLESLVRLEAASLDELRKESGCNDAARILKRIKQSHPPLAPFITLPGRKGHGGYRTTIRSAPQ
jgi:hypothetical protein